MALHSEMVPTVVCCSLCEYWTQLNARIQKVFEKGETEDVPFASVTADVVPVRPRDGTKKHLTRKSDFKGPDSPFMPLYDFNGQEGSKAKGGSSQLERRLVGKGSFGCRSCRRRSPRSAEVRRGVDFHS